MKKALALLALIGFLISGASDASALTTEQRSDRNSDGTQKFADPDEQMPNFVAGATEDQSNLRMTPSDSSPVTPPTYSDRNAGAAAFDQAYSHLQNSR